MPSLTRGTLLGAALLIAPCLLALHAGDAPKPAGKSSPSLRRPIAVALAQDGNWLLVANRDLGSIKILSTRDQKEIAEIAVGGRLSGLAVAGNRVLVIDEAAGELVLLAIRDQTLHEMRRLKTGLSPVSVRVSEDGKRATVACLWPRQLQVFDLTREAPASAFIDLPFAPRVQLLLPDAPKAIVADAFGGKLAVLDLDRKAIDSMRSLSAHNLRGLALDAQGKHVLLTHQILYSQGRANAGDIRSGSLIDNNLRRLTLANLLDPQADLLRDERLNSLGDVEQGAGDPSDVVALGEGRVAIAMSGVDELHVGNPEHAIWTRIPVGRRPASLAFDRAGGRIFVANTFSDSISVVDLKTAKVVGAILLGPTRELLAAERGEVIFHDAKRSFEGWFSCQSCHADGHTSGQLNDNLTDGSFGTPKRVLSLLGAKDTGPWAWNGKMPDLESQVKHSIRSTMHGREPTKSEASDLAAFLKSLPAPPSLLKSRGKVDEATLERGRGVFAREKCADCHAPPTYTTPRVYDVGLRDEAGGKLFNPPSLRGVSQGGPYFHDGRARTLEEVFSRFAHPGGDKLNERDLRDLLHFLNAL